MIKKQVRVGEQQIAYLEAGDRSQPTILMLHGVPESSLLWQDVLATAAERGFHGIAPDLPGFGDSDSFTEDSTWERYEAFVSEFLAVMEIEDVHLFVHDWGGPIGMRWACRNQSRVKSLLISDTVYLPEYEWHDMAKVWRTPGAGEQAMEQMGASREQWEKLFSSLVPGISPEQLHDFFRPYRSKADHKTILDLYRSGDLEKVKPYQGQLGALGVPTTLVWGEKDPYVTVDWAYKMKEQEIPHAEVRIVEGAGHFIYIEAPEKVKVFVEEHLGRL